MWTAEREVELASLVASGKSAGYAASLWGVSRNSVVGKIRRMGLKGPNSKDHHESRKRRVRDAKRKYVRGVPQPGTKLVAHPDAPPSLNISLMDLASHHCRWIEGEPNRDATYCGHPVKEGPGCYCEYHHRLAYRPVSSRGAWI